MELREGMANGELTTVIGHRFSVDEFVNGNL
jgi:hypothetical protein